MNSKEDDKIMSNYSRKRISIILLIIIMIQLFNNIMLLSPPLTASAVDVDLVWEYASEIMYKNEGSYSSVNPDDHDKKSVHGAISVGKLQWHGTRALNLLKNIIEINPENANSILGNSLYNEIISSSSWENRYFSYGADVNNISKLLKTEQSKSVQDNQANKDVTGYIYEGINMGIENTSVLIFYIDMCNQGPVFANRVASNAAKEVGGYNNITLDVIYQTAMNDSWVLNNEGQPERRTRTYNYCKSIKEIQPKKWYDELSPIDIGDNFYAHIENAGKPELLSNIEHNVQGANAIGTDNQIWHFVRQNDGSYAILSYSDGWSMDVSMYGKDNGTNIQMMPYVGNTAQRFFIYEINDYYYIKPLCSDRVFDMDLESYNIATWDYSSSYDNKKFIIRRIDCDGNLPKNIGDDFYAHIENVGKPELLSNIEHNVQGADAIGTDNQIWHFVRQNDGSYAILSYSDDWSMDVSMYGKDNGTNIQMMPYVGNTAQRFFIYEINDYYYIKPLCSDRVFDMDLESYNIATWDYSSSYDNKKFKIKEVEPTIKGDCNGDGEFNISDVVVFQNWLLGRTTEIENWKAADLCEDGKLNVFDLCLMRRMLIYG